MPDSNMPKDEKAAEERLAFEAEQKTREVEGHLAAARPSELRSLEPDKRGAEEKK